jgi:hypothetical protein
MAKVSVGLRGWRFDEDEIFSDDGDWRPIDEMSDDTRNRILRLANLVEKPCDACYLVHGEEDIVRCTQAAIVYGEPGDEVLLCDAHESDFLYWFREAGGRELAGEEAFRDSFHEWFASGERAPDGYGPDEHVETDPEAMPDLPTPKEAQEAVEEAYDYERVRYDLREAAGWEEPDEEVDLDDVDFDTDYPTG